MLYVGLDVHRPRCTRPSVQGRRGTPRLRSSSKVGLTANDSGTSSARRRWLSQAAVVCV
jgi:hypothetical protein